MFGVVFPNRSFPMDISSFAQIDTTHWILDMNTFVGEAYDSIREVCMFLLNGLSLPPDKALAVYIQSPGSPFLYCGAVTVVRPSAVLSLPWPEPGGQMQLTAPDAAPLSAKIGVSVEDLATLPSLDVAAEKRIEHLAMKVGENLFNFMQSFCGVDGSRLVVPMDILDRWFKKFQERAKRDPEYLKGFSLNWGVLWDLDVLEVKHIHVMLETKVEKLDCFVSAISGNNATQNRTNGKDLRKIDIALVNEAWTKSKTSSALLMDYNHEFITDEICWIYLLPGYPVTPKAKQASRCISTLKFSAVTIIPTHGSTITKTKALVIIKPRRLWPVSIMKPSRPVFKPLVSSLALGLLPNLAPTTITIEPITLVNL
ncbi:hypothetical protein TEA_018197 [Camellia sinensis var. sinensis]|uniref:Uncharacterized protein n=2 Tax=Camellia sinensis TaxID=4442 RepID=A0A4S4D223_CAMSN|nr:hypothetical protein TEA_018197 [Camellia sinensis var. sinensis]